MSPFAEPLAMFKILTCPVPINETSNHATHLVDLPDILAVTRDLTYTTLINMTFINAAELKMSHANPPRY